MPPATTPPLDGAQHLGATLAGILVSLLILLAPIAGLVSASLRDDPVGLVPAPSPGPAPIPVRIPAQIPVRILLH